MAAKKKPGNSTMRIKINPATLGLASDASDTAGDVGDASCAWIADHLRRATPFYKLLESVYDAVIITTRDGTILECNGRALDFFRMNLDALVNRNIVTLISGATGALIDTINKNSLSKKYTLVEARAKRSDGTSFPSEIAINQVDLDSAGQLCFFFRDITIRKRAQEELQNAVERLEEHDRARMEFVSNCSHELRTPLTSMIYAVSNMLRGVVGPIPERAIGYLERLEADSKRLLATVNDILDMRQIETNKLVLTKVVAPLGVVVCEGADPIIVQAEAKQITVDMHVHAHELFCLCDVQKLERVVLNVIGNAVKFTPAQGVVTVTVSRTPNATNMARIAVCDTGMGIPEEMLPKLSQRYFRIGDHVNGTGLGLAISREIVELHGGHISFASPVPGKTCGTAVFVDLPLVTPPSVLGVSPNSESATFLMQKVPALGYSYQHVDTARAALTSIAETAPSVLIIEYHVDDLPIPDIVMQVRERPALKRLPIIVLGRSCQERKNVELYRQFGVFYFQQPWTDEKLEQALSMAILGKLR